MSRTQQSGFTLIEVLMALAVFAMIAGVLYAALGTAGNGFAMLKDTRESVNAQQWLGRQLRMDTAYTGPSEDASLIPLQITQDVRGGNNFDELTLLVFEPGKPVPSLVHYAIDEQQGELVRESRSVLARDSVEPERWSLGKATSFDVEVMDLKGQWQQRWEPGKPFVWPKALRVHLVNGQIERRWVLPLWPGDAGSKPLAASTPPAAGNNGNATTHQASTPGAAP